MGRLDVALVKRGLARSRKQAGELIASGAVTVNGTQARKPSQVVSDADRLDAVVDPYVSRAAHKLLGVLDQTGTPLSGRALDAGASTGGFTDCLLQHGAARVYAVDVGTAQLHEKLRADARVVSMENVNLRHAPADLLPEPVDVIVADVSFISLTKVLPSCLRFLKPGGFVAALVKPQFELSPDKIGKGGVVREEAYQQEAVEAVTAFARDELGLTLRGVVPSKVKGPKGNQEYLAVFDRPAG